MKIAVVGTMIALTMLTACSSNDENKPTQKVVNNRSCSENMYELGEMIQNMHYLGYSRRSAMDTLVQNYGPSMNSLSDFTAVVWAMPKGHWAKGEVGGQLRDEAIRQGCV